jgi:hypothetical protein
MRQLASLVASSVILLTAVSMALAVPYTYEFTSGALTGEFAADAAASSYPFQSGILPPRPELFGALAPDSYFLTIAILSIR